ncbi:MAG: InlB B-repeat-containing protein [Clostridiales bacterium]|nr:InlB B-repeat-containing protein [Clostridiales bacterium]
MRKLQKRSVMFTAMLVAVLMVVATCFIACNPVDIPSQDKGKDPVNTDTYCVVAFYANGGSDVETQQVNVGGKVSRPADPTRSGYDFGGWYKDRDFQNEWNFDTDTVSGTSLLLYAKWTEHGSDIPEPLPSDEYCIVTLYPDNGTVFSPQEIKVGEKISNPNAAKQGYTLDGWYTDSGKKWNFDVDTVSGQTLVLRARWTLIQQGVTKCVVTFVTNCSATVPQQTIDEGGKVSQPNITNTGYTLDGWYTNGGKKWDFGVDTVSGETLVLSARWTLIQQEITKCVVTFVTNCSATVPQQTIDIGGKVSQPNIIANTGYTLDGWYNGNTKWDFNTDTVSGATLTLTARWTAVGTGSDVTVTFNVGRDARLAGVYNPAAVTVAAGSTISEPQLTRDGYTLSGWYVENDNTKWNFSVNTVTTNTTLFAKWTAGGSSGGTAIDYTPTMTNNNTLYIHYLRNDNSYDGWAVWVWTTGGGTRYSSVAVDTSGTVLAIDLNAYGNPSSINFKIGVIPDGGGSWNGSDGGDVSLNLSSTQRVGGSYHWYITEGKTANGNNKLVAATPVGGGNSTTESKRESISNVNRAYAQSLPVMSTVSGWDEMGVGYQIFVASFCDSNGDGCGDLNGITSKLDYLQSLNVDVLWLTPIQSSDSYHGYDCYDYYSIDPKFGTNADYRRLVSEAHSRGMKIIMDLVVNHTSQQNEWFQKSKNGVIEEVTYQDGTKATVNYRDFYRWKSSGGNRMESAGDGWYFYSSFNSSMPELNYDYQPVRDAMVDVAAYWMSYGLDGFRMDAIKHVFMWDECDHTGDTQGGTGDTNYEYNETKNIEFFKEFNYKLKTKYPHCYLLGEQLSGNSEFVSKFYQGMDSLFDFNTYYNLPGRLDGGAAATANEFNSNAQKYSTNRGDRPINCMISSNHDVNRLNSKINGSTEKAKLYMAVIMTMPGLPWIYYGDEIGLKESGGGDNAYRQPMKWTSSWANKCTVIDGGGNGDTKSVAEQESDDNSMLSYVKKLTKFRNDNPALINGTATCSEENGMLKIVVTGGGRTYTVYHNFSGNSKSISGNVVFGSSNIPAYGTAIVG